MMAGSGRAPTFIDLNEHLATGAQCTPGPDTGFNADRSESATETFASCFEQCRPLRTHCPGPAAQASHGHAGRWMPVCRRVIDQLLEREDGIGQGI